MSVPDSDARRSVLEPSGPSAERLFVLVAVAVLVASAMAAVAVPTAASPDAPVAFDPGVPAEYDFEAPSAPGTATVDGETYDSVQAAVDAAEPGDTVRLSGRFDERVVVETPGVTLVSEPGTWAMLDGGGEDHVLAVEADNVTVRRVWVRNSGRDPGGNDAGIWVNGTGTRIVDSRLTEITFGIWVEGVSHVRIENNTIVGREDVRPLSYRGNGIHLWKTEDSVIADNRITDVRDGIYYSWATNVTASRNTMWELRYGVHYMYSDACRLENNTAFDNDVGYALMLSERITVVDNLAVNNTGTSGHGILLKRIDDSEVGGNVLVGNGRGLYLLNAVGNRIADNLVMENAIGVHLTAGTEGERVVGNSFINNRQAVLAVTSEQTAWNGTERGNYWSGASTGDVDRDGVSEVRHRPAGLVEYLVREHPAAAAFAHSPAFEALRQAESTFPTVEAPGVIDHHPLTDPPHEDWQRYYARETAETRSENR